MGLRFFLLAAFAALAVGFIILVGLFSIFIGLFSNQDSSPSVTLTTTITVTSTTTTYLCEEYAVVRMLYLQLLYGIDEVYYYGTNAVLTQALNMANAYIEMARNSTNTVYMQALMNIVGFIDAYGRNDIRAAYKYYVTLLSQLDYLETTCRIRNP